MADQGQQVLRIVVEVVLPGVLLDLHLGFPIVLHKCFVKLATQLLELLDRRQQEGSNPLRLVQVFLTGLDSQDRHGIFVSFHSSFILKLD